MKNIAVIPARLDSTRLPSKMLLPLGDKTLIRATYENIVAMQLFDQVVVATDDVSIFDEISNHGGLAIMTKKSHETGSDRIAEVVQSIDVELVINVQGDEPFISKKPLETLLNAFQNSTQTIDVATLKMPLHDEEDIKNPNNVKVITDIHDYALYFSRSPIPYKRDLDNPTLYFQHIGVYAFRKEALLSFATLPLSPNEKAEKIECLRYLENGMRIKVIQSDEKTIGIDTADDLEKANQYLSSLQ